VTPNQLVASKREVRFDKGVTIHKKMTTSVTSNKHVYCLNINLGRTQHTQTARYAQHLERMQCVNALPKNSLENVSGDETLEGAPPEGQPTVIDDDELKAATEPDSRQTCQELAKRFNVNVEAIRRHPLQNPPGLLITRA
jgi:hypothetical protein